MAIDLLKKKVGIVLEKRQMTKVICEVKFALDISGSMERMYKNGTVQNLTDRLLAVASKFDDNGEMEVWTFSHGFDQLKTITEDMHEGYVKKQILDNPSCSKWGGTSYSPVMEDIVKQSFTRQETSSQEVKTKPSFLGKLFGAKETSTAVTSTEIVEHNPQFPVFVPFITDGENSDKRETEAIIRANAHRNIYWMMIGIGSEDFRWLREIADRYDNVGFISFKDVEHVSDEDFYSNLLNEEFCTWVKKFA